MNKTATTRHARLLAVAAAAIFAPSLASNAFAKKAPLPVVNVVPAATEFDLSLSATASVQVNGVTFQNTDIQPTGTGVIRSFVRLQSPGNATTESGHNTDFRALENDENNSPQFTRSLLLDDLAVFDVGGADFYKLLLDVNEPNGRSQSTISLDEFELYQADSPVLHGYDATTKFGADATLVYDLDAAADSYLKLDANLNSGGSGSGDMFAFIPTSLFNGEGDYLYLFSSFGGHFAAQGGFEEWAAVTGDDAPPNAIPLPPAAWSGLTTLGLMLGGAGYRRYRAQRGHTA